MNPVTLFMAAVLALSGGHDTGSQGMIVVVRHAEQTDENERDPPLSDAGRARAAALESAPDVRRADMKGRPMKGWLLVAPEATADDGDLGNWVRRGEARASAVS